MNNRNPRRANAVRTLRLRILLLIAALLITPSIGRTAEDECKRVPRSGAESETELFKAESRFAECTLVRQTAGLMTAELTNGAFDRAELLRSIDEGLVALESARKLAERMKVARDEPSADARERIEMLQAFGATWRAIAAADGTPESAAKLTTACIELALYTDDPNPHIAEAAKLWQAHAYRKAGRADRTLQMLHPVLTAGTGSRVDLFLRLERCRALADAGHYIAAVTLAIKIEGKIDAWMQREPVETRDAARVTVRSARAEILKRWAEALRERGADERAKEAESAANAISQSIKQPNNEPLMLDALIVGLDEPPIPTTQPDS